MMDLESLDEQVLQEEMRVHDRDAIDLMRVFQRYEEETS